MEQSERTVVGVLGLGEAGGAFSTDLAAAGAVVRGYDPAVTAGPELVAASSEADAADGADLVLSVNRSATAVAAMEAGIGALPEGSVWADLNTASPATKRRLAEIAEQHGAAFADVAIMAPVPGPRLRVPMLVSGTGAERAAELLRRFGANVEVLDGPAGLAATRKLLRSVYFKGMAASIVEALEAARAAGFEDLLRENIIADFTAAGQSTVERIISGTHQHSRRRTDEMAAAAEMLTDLGVSPAIATASRDLHARLTEEQA
ncbi:NAD(P)-dependent oxidoreductase [Saccharopolyspora rhizosphaerae]|uniref:NAD(P)-dependent oxidoreductase n=1 Tax=Saccharopolyspora rhizosphaerae TaxID=2492662 RepID=A0A3R8R7X1_9PSEU|nr:DUF1932 domain-containing protein [Saccharopolyspora rhizosphaerae]RRO20434.1 NAD(P)-dependent oxidoreductase [Saccharopolyspora rhizosphaerae]